VALGKRGYEKFGIGGKRPRDLEADVRDACRRSGEHKGQWPSLRKSPVADSHVETWSSQAHQSAAQVIVAETHVHSPQEKENYSAEEKMRNNRLTDQAALLMIFMVVLTFGEPFAELRVVAFGLGALIWIVWRGK
jgi:hypothetical protein